MRRLLLLLPLPILALWVLQTGLVYETDELQLTITNRPATLIRLPGRIAEYSMKGNASVYGRDNLYEYVNGRAEFFLSYGFVSLSVGYYGSGGSEVVVEIYDMEKPENALGVLKQERGGANAVELEQSSAFAQKGIFLFSKGRYYAKLGYLNTADDSQAAAIAKELAASIKAVKAVKRPELLPLSGKVPQSDLFVKSDYMGLSFLSEVQSARYKFGGEELEAFSFEEPPDELVRFFTEEGAKVESFNKGGFKRAVIKDKYEGTIHIITDGANTTVLKGAAPEESVEKFMREAAANMKKLKRK